MELIGQFNFVLLLERRIEKKDRIKGYAFFLSISNHVIYIYFLFLCFLFLSLGQFCLFWIVDEEGKECVNNRS